MLPFFCVPSAYRKTREGWKPSPTTVHQRGLHIFCLPEYHGMSGEAQVKVSEVFLCAVTITVVSAIGSMAATGGGSSS